MKYKNDAEAVSRRIEKYSEKYNCDGHCYYSDGTCCSAVDICDETRVGEFLASIIAILVIIATSILAIAGILFLIFF